METLDHARVTVAEGVHGDFRGGLAATKPTRRRQVTVLEAECWRAALNEVAAPLDWHQSRRNLLVEGAALPRQKDMRLRIGASLVLEVTGECDPCERMDALCRGLRAAMTPDWRGGLTTRVIEDGEIEIGDEVTIL